MDASEWTLAPGARWIPAQPGSVRSERYEGMPDGTMTLDGVVAVSKNTVFTDGAIDFDIKPTAFDDTGIIPHRHGEDGGEFVYLRADPDCPAADDCVQYALIRHGHMAWNLYSNFQGPTLWLRRAGTTCAYLSRVRAWRSSSTTRLNRC